MKDEYDFSKGERGRFFRQDIELHLPVYLDHDIEVWFEEKAKAKGISIQQLVNQLLRKDISLIKEVL